MFEPAIHVTSGIDKSALSATTVAVVADFSPRTSMFEPALIRRRKSAAGVASTVSCVCGEGSNCGEPGKSTEILSKRSEHYPGKTTARQADNEQRDERVRSSTERANRCESGQPLEPDRWRMATTSTRVLV